MVLQEKTPPQEFKGISCALFHNEAVGGLTLFATNSFQHLGRYEAHVLREVLSGIQNHDHQEENLWDKETFWRDSTRVLGKI
ncbi:hypothetical protein CR513_10066, partial [Mucuna pruriens]